MKLVADYFVAAFKQYSNQISNNSATRAALVITNAIDEDLSASKSERLHCLLPANLAPTQQQFFAWLGNWQPSYSDLPIEIRLVKRLSLTDRIEAEVLLLAYFKSVKELLEPATWSKLILLLPPDLQKYYDWI